MHNSSLKAQKVLTKGPPFVCVDHIKTQLGHVIVAIQKC
jgi:hypothetical protein